ncbi:hypothetical protein GDO81_026427 [Engystomops pustulosus]|uniref:Uncharacterized protein n=1 Tax=Engystomops pustulosus TaxID=76066 RepID=A0AAV6YJY0_ENGPU|nr:hypothetical protein GDO81_026427 [Engystomops pustulosus]
MGNRSNGGDVIWDVSSHSHHLTDSSLLSKGHVQNHAVLGSISDIIHKSLLITIKTVNPTNIFAHSYLGNNDLSWGIPVHI